MKNHAFTAFLSGALLGAAAALLLAPEKGTTTRKKIKKTFREEKKKLADLIDEIREDVPEVADKLKVVVCNKPEREAETKE